MKECSLSSQGYPDLDRELPLDSERDSRFSCLALSPDM
jgi:hypothetical protein